MSAVDFDPHISVEPVANVKNPDYCIRAINLENLRKTIDTPFKIISGDDVDITSFKHYSSQIPNAIFENARFLQDPKSWKALEKYLTELPATQRNNKLREFFKIDKKLWDNSLTMLSLTFPRNPLKCIRFQQQLLGGLMRIATFSFSISFIPIHQLLF